MNPAYHTPEVARRPSRRRQDYTKLERLLWRLFLVSAIPMVLFLTLASALQGILWVSGKSLSAGSPAVPYNLDIISIIVLPVLWLWGIRHFDRPKKSAGERLVLLLLLFAYGVQLWVTIQAPAEENVLLVLAFFLWDILFWVPALFLAGLIAVRVFPFHGR